MLYRLVCRHDFLPLRNIYGDEINIHNARSVWICRKCKKGRYSGRLLTDSDFIESERNLKIKYILDVS